MGCQRDDRAKGERVIIRGRGRQGGLVPSGGCERTSISCRSTVTGVMIWVCEGLQDGSAITNLQPILPRSHSYHHLSCVQAKFSRMNYDLVGKPGNSARAIVRLGSSAGVCLHESGYCYHASSIGRGLGQNHSLVLIICLSCGCNVSISLDRHGEVHMPFGRTFSGNDAGVCHSKGHREIQHTNQIEGQGPILFLRFLVLKQHTKANRKKGLIYSRLP
jgi:hypothetical protein